VFAKSFFVRVERGEEKAKSQFGEVSMHTYVFAFRCDVCGFDWTEYRKIEEHEDADGQIAVCMVTDECGEVEAHFYEEADR